MVCRDLVPGSLTTQTYPGGGWYYPWSYTNWPSSNQWAAGYDWTSWYYESSGSNAYRRVFETGMGNPLEPGTYYVGVINSGGVGPLNYTIASRGIGPERSIPVENLAFVGSTVLSSLARREAAYFRIIVPSNQPNWKLHLENTLGESMFALQKDFLPNISAGTSYYPFDVAGGRALQKAGNENYLLLPKPGQTNLPGGTYYLAVISEGMNPSGSRIGSNACGFTFTSYGPLLYTNLGTVGVVDLVESNYLEGAETKIYQFSVPLGTPAVEVRLDDRVDANVPYMRLRADGRPPNGQYYQGGNGGENPTWAGNTLFTLPNLVTGLYTLNLQAYPVNDATFTVSCTTNATAINWTNVVSFYNGTVSNLVPAYGVWNLRIDVPPEARRLYLASTSANSVTFYLDQGSLPTPAAYGVITRNPVQPWYTLGQHVQLTASPNLGYGFVGWSGDASGNANPYDLVMNSHKTVTANFAVTNDSGADYLFQLNLKSTVGLPPDLLNYAAGNIYSNDTVDGCARTVLAFQIPELLT